MTTFFTISCKRGWQLYHSTLYPESVYPLYGHNEPVAPCLFSGVGLQSKGEKNEKIDSIWRWGCVYFRSQKYRIMEDEVDDTQKPDHTSQLDSNV